MTGAAQGIGRAIAARQARSGRRVWCVDVDEAVLNRTVAELRATRAEVRSAVCDVGNADAVRDAWSRIDAEGDQVTDLVNNAGIFRRETALDVRPEDWDRVVSVNLTGAFLMAQQAARRLVERGAAGAIVSVASGQAFRPAPRGVAYAASKAGLVNSRGRWQPSGGR